MAQILFIDYLGVYHRPFTLELNQIHSGLAHKKHHLRSLILCCVELIYPQ